MPSASTATLPPELWLIILDMVIGTGISPLELSNYIPFPDILNHIRGAWIFPSMRNPWLSDLRHVSRTFKDILGPSPHYFMGDSNAMIPISAKALYIASNNRDPQPAFQRLQMEPSKSHRIVMLDLPMLSNRGDASPSIFDLLCDNSHLLPGVRSLTLGLEGFKLRNPRTVMERFWARLNDAFPHLTCLSLKGAMGMTHDNAATTLEKLEILDMGLVSPSQMVRFPALRYASFSRISHHEIQDFTAWSGLVAVLLKDFDLEAQFDWSMFPRLRLIGFPAPRVRDFPPLPSGHSLRHFYLYVATKSKSHLDRSVDRYEEQLEWFRMSAERFPKITQIKLEFAPCSERDVQWILGYFRDDFLEDMGFSQRYESIGTPQGRERLALERVPAHSSARDVLKAGWSKLLHLSSSTFHT